MSDKPLDPTPLRKEKATRDGDVPRASELPAVVAFAGASLAAFALVPLYARTAALALHAAARGADGRTPLAALTVAAFAPAAVAACAATGTSFALTGGLRLKFRAPSLAGLNPIAGLKRMVGREALVGAARALAAFAVALGVLLPALMTTVVRGAGIASPVAAATLVLHATGIAIGGALAVGLAFSFADVALARRTWLRKLRMSHDEVRRESREQDGDPHVRARRRSTHKRVVAGAIARTREASFVVVNPTHVAVALRYDPPAVPVPEILVRAVDDAALRVRTIARGHGIAVIEDVALARLLYRTGSAGDPIPPETFVAVAQIVASLVREGVLS